MAGTFDPNTAENLPEIEKQFAVKAVEHAQTYWNVLQVVPPRELRLTRVDDEIFEHTKKDFPELFQSSNERLVTLDEDWIKSKEGKKRWQSFIKEYENKIKDYNFGCLVRTDAREEYSQNNSMFVTRIQFYAFEISRNKLGLNDSIYEKAKAGAVSNNKDVEKQVPGSKKSS